LIGLVVGLIIAALLAFPFSLLPPPFGRILPFVGVLLLGYMGVAVFVMRQNDLFSMLSSFSIRAPGSAQVKKKALPDSGNWGEGRTIFWIPVLLSTAE
jgi:uncharacterized protein YacL